LVEVIRILLQQDVEKITIMEEGGCDSMLPLHYACRYKASLDCKRDLDMQFCSNIDGTHMAKILRKCDAVTTLFLISLKTFTTQETMTNVRTVERLS